VSATSEPERRDPGEYLDHDPPRADERRAAVNALLATFVDWMRDQSRRLARRYDLDGDDVFQHTWERLLHSSTVVDLSNKGVRKWLAQRIDWAAKELARQRRHDGGERIDDEQLDMLLVNADSEKSQADPPATAIDTGFLGRIGLTPHQVRVVLSECSELDLSLRDFAHLVGRSYAAIRKDKQRALDRIERWVGLNPEERRVFIAFRLAGSVDEGARRTGHTRSEFSGLLDAAHKKVDAAFTERRVDPDVS
jgi:DNA-directed RNA polymerase specialized sigma24 family protein